MIILYRHLFNQIQHLYNCTYLRDMKGYGKQYQYSGKLLYCEEDSECNTQYNGQYDQDEDYYSSDYEEYPEDTTQFGDYKEEKIINNEKLKKVQLKDFKYVKHYTLGALSSKNGMKQRCGGSGVLISKNIVLTAAHNLYDHKSKKKHYEFKFYHAAHGITNQYYEIEDYRYLPWYQYKKKFGNDFALVKLKQDILLPQYLPLKAPCAKCITGASQKIQIYGYPGINRNFDFKDQKRTKIKLYQYGLSGEDRVTKAGFEEGQIYYTMSTFSGQSGAPVVADNKIIAVHVGCKSKPDLNVGRVITPQMLDKLQQWCYQLQGDPFSIDQEKCKNCYKKNILPKLNAKAPPFPQTLNSTRNSFTQQKPKIKIIQPNRPLFSKINQPKLFNKNESAAAIFQQGLKRYKNGKYSQAIKIFTKCLQVQEQIKGGSIGFGKTLRFIGNCYFKMEQYQQAKENYQQSVAKYQTFSNLHQNQDYAQSLFLLGQEYIQWKKYKAAEKALTKALKIYQTVRNLKRALKCSQILQRAQES